MRKTFVREDSSGSLHRSRTGRVQRGGSPAQPRQPLLPADTSMKFPCWSAPWGSTKRTPSSTAPADRTMRSIMSGSGCSRGLRDEVRRQWTVDPSGNSLSLSPGLSPAALPRVDHQGTPGSRRAAFPRRLDRGSSAKVPSFREHQNIGIPGGWSRVEMAASTARVARRRGRTNTSPTPAARRPIRPSFHDLNTSPYLQ